MKRFHLYILDEDGNPVPTDDAEVWGRWVEQQAYEDRVVKQDFEEGVDGERRRGVSTVFLGIDHNFGGEGPPILWETLVFLTDSPLDGVIERYSSKEAALRGHERMVERVRRAVAKKRRAT